MTRYADWRDHAACRHADPDLFFPIGTSGLAPSQIDEANASAEAARYERDASRGRWTTASPLASWEERPRKSGKSCGKHSSATRAARDSPEPAFEARAACDLACGSASSPLDSLVAAI